jgi:DNA repair photolyase
VAPIIPGLNDPEIEAILKAAKDAGASSAAYTLLRLPLEVATLFQEWLATHTPDRAKRVLSLIRQIRGGALYKSEFGTRMKGEGPIADLISKRFHGACRRLGLDKPGYDLDCSQFKVPAAPDRQFNLGL